MITHGHPAVRAAHTAAGDLQSTPAATWVHGLTAALPHLTADDLRDTPAGRALMAEAWAAGYRDCWGDWEEGGPWRGNLTPNPYKETPDE